jgi:hypothetical protein
MVSIMPAPKGHKAYNKQGEGGRPVKYSQDFVEREADAFEEWMEHSDNLYFKRFALDRGYHPNQLSIWAKENDRFSCVYEKAQAWQEVRLVEGGLRSEFNAGFCKFVMGNTCGWVERKETKVSGDLTNPLAFLLEQIDGSSKSLLKDE